MEKELILNKLKEYKNSNFHKYGIEKMGLFGSFARDEATNLSDIDVCIETKNADMFMLVHIKDELQNILSTKIDIVRLREKMNPFLKNRIEKEVIYV